MNKHVTIASCLLSVEPSQIPQLEYVDEDQLNANGVYIVEEFFYSGLDEEEQGKQLYTHYINVWH